MIIKWYGEDVDLEQTDTNTLNEMREECVNMGEKRIEIKQEIDERKIKMEKFKQNKKYLKLFMKLSSDLKLKGHDLFVNWSPHVMSCRVYLYVNGWKSECDPDLWGDFYLYEDNCKEKVEEINRRILTLVS